MRQLHIYNNKVFAGILTETDDKKYEFAYDGVYVNSKEPCISLTLPKRTEPYHSDFMFSFFANILPEGANKKWICRRYHIDESDDMGLLTFFSGKDFIGSISVETINNAQV